MNLLLAVDTLSPDTPIIEVVTGVAVAGVVGALAFMLKRSFNDVTDTLKALGSKVDGFAATQAAQGTAMALQEQWRNTAKDEIAELRRAKHDLVSTVTAIRGENALLREESKHMKEAISSLQQQMADMRGDSGARRTPRRHTEGD